MEEPSPSIESLTIMLQIFQGISFESLIYFLIIIVLILCSGLVSGSEVAFFSLEPRDHEELSEQDTKSSKQVLELLARPKKLLATILIANNFINIGIIILSSVLTEMLFDFSEVPLLGFIIQVIAITFILLLMGEVIPKVYANQNSLRISQVMSFPILILSKAFNPLSQVLIRSTRLIDSRFNRKQPVISVNDLTNALELTKEEDVEQDEQKILEGIVRFGNTDVKQIMTSRIDVMAVDRNLNFEELSLELLNAGFSRVPVYDESFDRIVGVIYLKDLLPYIDEEKDFDWQQLIRSPYFVPENKKIDDLLNEFREKKIHMAVVVDEFGGTSGVVTLEDILEEIVGDISDEFDTEDLIYSKLDEKTYIFDGKTPLNDIYRILNIDGHSFEERKGEADTVAGFIIEIAERIPNVKEVIPFLDYSFEIEAADKRRISTVKMTIHESATNSNKVDAED